MTIQPIGSILSYHAHVYFEGPEQRAIVDAMREEIAQRFSVVLGRVHDRPIGPHARPMFQVAFAPEEFARIVPWLMLNRRNLAVLLHPNTGRPKRDHLADAAWLGEILSINDDPLVEEEGPEPALFPNTQPTLAP
jgi:aromatic ring-cleaving dioxygenase